MHTTASAVLLCNVDEERQASLNSATVSESRAEYPSLEFKLAEITTFLLSSTVEMRVYFYFASDTSLPFALTLFLNFVESRIDLWSDNTSALVSLPLPADRISSGPTLTHHKPALTQKLPTLSRVRFPLLPLEA